MLYTTLNKIRAAGPCGLGPKETTGFRKLLNHLGKKSSDDEPLGFDVILASNGLGDALWCLRSIDEPVFCRRLAVAFCREVRHLMKDSRSIAALDVASRFSDGLASAEELAEARAAAARAIWAVAARAEWAAAAARAAADAAAVAVAVAVADAAEWAAATATATSEAKAKQSTIFLTHLEYFK